MAEFVIIGNGVAGVRAAETIRSHNSSGSIVMISEEEYPFYYRPLLPEYVAGLVEEERLWSKPKDFYIRHNIELALGRKAIKIDPAEKLVFLENGENIPYDALLIATGGNPAPVRCLGWDLEGVGHLKTLSDARKLREKVKDASVGVVIGAGILGLELIDTFVKCGLDIHYVLPGDNIWPAILDEKASGLVENYLRKIGVKVYKRAGIKQINSEDNKVKKVLLANGETISCELVGLGIGLQPNIDMVRWSGLQVRGMIFVNRAMKTNIPNIFAAGDVALCYEIPGEAGRCLPRWRRAWKQGEVAGLNMVEIETDYREIPICAVSTKIAGTPLLCLGNPNPSEQSMKTLLGMDQNKGIYKKIVLRNHRIKGALFITDLRGGGKVTQFMQQGTDITASEEISLQEIVKVEGSETAILMVCPICKMEISPAGCPACGR